MEFAAILIGVVLGTTLLVVFLAYYLPVILCEPRFRLFVRGIARELAHGGCKISKMEPTGHTFKVQFLDKTMLYYRTSNPYTRYWARPKLFGIKANGKILPIASLNTREYATVQFYLSRYAKDLQLRIYYSNMSIGAEILKENPTKHDDEKKEFLDQLGDEEHD